MPEITWSQLCRCFTPGFESLLDHGVNACWYDTNNTLQVLVFRWVFIPWLQWELNAYQDHVNNSVKQHDRNKILPHGVPNLIYKAVKDFGTSDFKVFRECISQFYDGLDCPAVTWQSAWEIYLQLLEILQCANELPPWIELLDNEDEDVVPLLDNYQDLPAHEESNGAYYMGGVNRGLGMDTGHHHQLDSLEHDNELELTGAEEVFRLDDAGLVISKFSDCEDDDRFADEW
ncbi:hypothetical protein DFH29DRAFT_1000934 [Suillus ampliporus]|nr:hypothetical protein DFH29DRAFT_1000934 [Suillus ampliporus]